MAKHLLIDGKIIYPNKLKLKKNINLAFIGSGDIAKKHADVVLSFNHKIKTLLTKSKSIKTNSFKKKYKVESHFTNINLFKKNIIDKKIHAIIVCVNWEESNKVFKNLFDLNIPILFEKSLKMNSLELDKLNNKYNLNNFYFAYNRNYYDFIPYLSFKHKRYFPEIVLFNLPDTFEKIINKRGDKIIPYLTKYITSHWISFFYIYLKILGISIDKNFNNIDIDRLEIKKSRLLKIFIKNKFNLVFIITLVPNNASNIKVEIFSNKMNFIIEPFEKLRIFNKLNMKKIKGNNIFSPNNNFECTVDHKFKPGFRSQYYDFINLNFTDNYKSLQSIKVKDLIVIYKICELLN